MNHILLKIYRFLVPLQKLISSIYIKKSVFLHGKNYWIFCIEVSVGFQGQITRIFNDRLSMARMVARMPSR